MKWADTKITIKLYDKDDVTINAKCKGIFAIHDIMDDGQASDLTGVKSLTHIPSGSTLIKQSTIGKLYRAAKQLQNLDWEGIEYGEKPPETFDMDGFRHIQYMFSD